MKNLKYILGSLLASLILFSCDNRSEYIDGYNESPSLQVRTASGDVDFNVVDTVKIVNKSGDIAYNFQLDAKDGNGDIESITYEFKAGTGVIKQDGQILDGNIEYREILDISIEVTTLGSNVIEFVVTDKFGQKSTAQLDLIAISNYKPVAVLTSSRVDVLSNLEYKLDGQESYDADALYGGSVVLYEFTVEGQVILSETNFINYVFPRSGNYQVKLRVKDSDEEWSDSVSEIFSI